jgi:hypothetical protein
MKGKQDPRNSPWEDPGSGGLPPGWEKKLSYLLGMAPGVSIVSEDSTQTIPASTPPIAKMVEFTRAFWPSPSSPWFELGEPDKVTVPQSGLYQVNWGVVLHGGSGVGIRTARLHLTQGGNPVDNPPCRDQQPANGNGVIFLGGSAVLRLTAGYEVRVEVLHTDIKPLQVGHTDPTYTNRLDLVYISSLE